MQGMERGLGLQRAMVRLFRELELVIVSGVPLLLVVTVLLCIRLGQLVVVVLEGIDHGHNVLDLRCSSNLFPL